ncbi:FAD-dependent oxidoreductase [Trichloromonas sp.]|uniref:FAD-dependent oxidoreductase n=1 Tax=Trichloromonas sp. TaxID=3069249 RepID=UPI002A4DEBD1|nr:FAD-dependent oxidoreductase [Trichloromonas sp.]
MDKTDVLIIGGSAAGLMAANTLKKRYPEKKVTVVRNVKKTPVPCGIPYIYGILKDVAKDIIPDEGFLNAGIEILSKHVEKVDRAGKTVTLNDGSSIGYEKLILGTGSKPFVPPMPGINLKNVFTVKKDPEYLDELYVALQKVKNVVVIGGGFIGVEMAEQIAKMSGAVCQDYFCTAEQSGATINVSLIEMLPHCLMLACEEEFGIVAENELKKMGINVMVENQVKSIDDDGTGKVSSVTMTNGTKLSADLVIIGIGAVPNIDLAESVGLSANPRGGFDVDEYLQTQDPDVYAAGDCAAKFSFFTGKPSGIRLASVACTEGMIAASNLYNEKSRKTMGALGAFATKVGERSIGAAGLTTKAAADEKIEVVIGEAVAPNRHPGALPGCIPTMKAKLLFRKDNGVIVGGHICGSEAAADMANVIAVAIQSKLTAEDMATMQYATHPLLTSSPLSYHVMLAAENAAAQLAK